jgi:hypothetical protein
MAEFTAEQIEAVDLSDLTAAQRVEIAGTLYGLAPGDDSLAKRRWVADRLRVQLREVNRILWGTYGIRWSLRPRKKPARPTVSAAKEPARRQVDQRGSSAAAIPPLDLPDFDPELLDFDLSPIVLPE